jgi:hypothetical protein
MKTRHFIYAGLLCISNAAFCTNSTEPNQKILVSAVKKYLAQQGDFCLGKFDWPIDVSESEFGMGTNDAVQMPVLEKLGLVISSNASAMRKVDEADISVPVKRYQLTEAGKAFYLPKESSAIVGGKKVMHTHDFCAGKLSLNKLVRWDKTTMEGKHQETTVTYTYKIAPAKWTQNPEIQAVFPMLTKVLKGEGSMQLQQQFRFSKKSWVPVNSWD